MKIKSKIFYTYALFVVAFVVLTLVPAPDKATLIRYHLSSTGLRVLDFTLLIPEFAIWFAAFYGYHALYRYSQRIWLDRDGKQIRKLAIGLGILAIGLPSTAIFSSILSVISEHRPSFQTATIIINNYIAAIYPLLAFVWISVGSRGLSDLAGTRPRLRVWNLAVLAGIALGVVFCCLIVLDHTQLRRTYHMSPELAMLTLGIPYMYTWFMGLFAVAELRAYSQQVVGIVYRKGWNLLISGFASIILLSIVLQYLSTLSTWLTSLSLGWVLLLLYVLLLLLTGAFIVVSLGAKQLMKIEEA